MMRITERPLSESELQHLSQQSPFFLFKNRREIWHQELDRGVAEILELEAIRAWEVNICTCCPNSYLFQVAADQYMFIESWAFTKYASTSGEFPRRNIRVERLPHSKKILALNIDGELVPAEEVQLALTDLPNFGDTECEVFRINQFSKELCSKLPAS
jgi:hypothetical protein